MWLPVGALTVAVLLPLATFIVATWLLGWRLHIVESGSMRPTFPIGSLLVVEPRDASEVQAGMAMTFEDPLRPGRLVTHRVTGVLDRPGGRMFTTRGDANVADDPAPVPARSVRGRVRWHVPNLGYAFDWLRWPRGFLVLVVAPSLVLGVTELRDRRSRSSRAAEATAEREAVQV
jgi:signal peptidase